MYYMRILNIARTFSNDISSLKQSARYFADGILNRFAFYSKPLYFV